MIRKLFEIGLVVALATPAGLYCAQVGSGVQQPAQISGQRLEVLGGLDEQIRLDRSVMEFAQEFSMFDDQLYGSLENGDDQRERLEELNEEISSTRDKLAQANYVLLNGWERFDGDCPVDLPCSEQEIRAEMDHLECELAAMKDQVSELSVRSLSPGENVILEISLWDNMMASGATRDILELIDTSINNARNSESSASGVEGI